MATITQGSGDLTVGYLGTEKTPWPTLRYPGIYRIVCLVNNKSYIGSSTSCVYRRISSHRTHLRAKKHHSNLLQKAWLKHGEINFYFHVIEFVTSQNCIAREQYWIDIFQAYNKEIGYNLASRVGNNLGIKYVIKRTDFSCSENAKKLLSAFHTGSVKSQETKNKLALLKQIPVIQLTLKGEFIQEFPSIKIAQQFLKFKSNKISGCCRGNKRYQTCYGFKWMYKKDYMAIHKEEIAEVKGGYEKVIDSGAKQIVFDLFQRSQYQFPIKSTVREVVSNGLDSIKEKQVAIAILTGKDKVRDHYITKEGEAYKDSKFNPDYYKLEWLSDKDYVEVIYNDMGEFGKDSVIIRDYGVGLGGSRLSGYFSIGFSSKRLASFALGKFGLGAKSPLSTNAPYYTMTSRYNGMEFQFNIYSMRFESIVPKFDMGTGSENPSYIVPNLFNADGTPAVVYYRPTQEKNMLQIEMPTKKHHKQQYIDAVTGQLLYFSNVRLSVKQEDGYIQNIPVQADIMFEDDQLVLSSNSPYSKPHILLDGVNYGFINFEELELDSKLGNIGIKVPSGSVSISPSRESLIWDDVTRDIVVNAFKQVVHTAESIINAELKETDFLKWLRTAATASASKSWLKDEVENTVIGRLAHIVDMSKIELQYPADNSIKWNYDTLEGIGIRLVEKSVKREGSKTIKTIEYSKQWYGALREGRPILFQKGNTSNRKNKYILEHVYLQGFLNIDILEVWDITKPLEPVDIPYHWAEEAVDKRLSERDNGKVKDRIDKAHERILKVYNFLLSSTNIMWYESINVPEEFTGNEADEEVEEDEISQEAKFSAAERRKLQGKTILATPRIMSNAGDSSSKFYEMQKIEVPVHAIDAWNNPEIYFSSQDFEPLLHTVALITRPYGSVKSGRSWKENEVKTDYTELKSQGYELPYDHQFPLCPWLFSTAEVRLIRVAQNNVKYYRDFKHITKFFKEIKNKTITMSNKLIKWNTARLMQEKIGELEFLKGFRSISAQKQLQYETITDYIFNHWRNLDINNSALGSEEATVNHLVSHLDKVGQFQTFVASNPDAKEEIAQLAKELFNPDPGVELTDGRAIELDIYKTYLELLDWAEPIKVMLNMIKPLIAGKEPNELQEQEIRGYLSFKNCSI